MDDRLDALLRLQDIDIQIQHVEEELRALPVQVRVAENELARATAALDEMVQDHLRLQKEADFKDLQLKSGDAHIQKLEQQRSNVKTNREYAALTAQIGGAEADKARLEDQILALFAKTEEACKAVAAQKAEVARLAARRDAVAARCDAEAARIRARLDDLRRQSQEAQASVSPELLEVYGRLRRRLGAPPLAAVRDEACTGCNMSVSQQTISELRLGRDLVQCKSCTRILYLDGDGS